MSAFLQVRTDVAAALTAGGMHAFTNVPEVATAPMAWVAPGDPYVTREDATFGGEIVTCEVVVVASAGTNEYQAEELDDLIVTALDALEAAGIDVTDVGRPGRVTISATNQTHLAAAIGTRTEIHR